MDGMGGMGMSGGMDQATSGMFKPLNESISHAYWGIITGIVGIGLIGNILYRLDSYLRIKRIRSNSPLNPTVPQNSFWRFYATTLTVFRELSYPQPFPQVASWGSFSWLTLPSLGKCLFILGYIITIIAMLTSNAILPHSDAYYFESMGFRAAWISVMQVPLIVLLGGRTNIVGFLIGSSYERLNWAHRWISRVLICCVAVHAGFFLREWIRADFVAIELEFMPVIKYGMGAGGLLLWMNISGLSPLRKAWYEFYVIQHLASIALFLWLLHVHVPSYAMYYVWMAIGFVAFDRIARILFLFFRNIHLFTKSKGKNRLLGYEVEAYNLPGHVTRLVVKDVSFKWKPGQHLHICIPRLGPWESHPFTISSAYHSTNPEVTLEIRAHTGITHRLFNFTKKQSSRLDGNTPKLLAFIQGPLGSVPTWNTYDSLVLISGSTGASFTLPIFESLIENPGCIRSVNVLMISRTAGEAACYLARLRKIVASLEGNAGLVSVKVCVCVTREYIGDEEEEQDLDLDSEPNDEKPTPNQNEHEDEEKEPIKDLGSRCLCGCDANGCGCICGSSQVDVEPERRSSDQKNASASEHADSIRSETDSSSSIRNQKSHRISLLTTKRPDVSRTIRQSVEAAWGETMVAVCGGKELSSKVRNVVSSLSDERAVHKGTGAQGIELWVEEFGL